MKSKTIAPHTADIYPSPPHHPQSGGGSSSKTSKRTNDFVREPNKPHLYQSYKGKRYCINWNLHGWCKFGKNCSQLHFCNYVGCDKGHVYEGCRSGDSSKHRW